MKKQYEKPEVEITMLDPELDIIKTSPINGGSGDFKYNPSNDKFEF